ncbi:hypothetical protein H8356DRAFT_1337394 [Neocallimastix lanati (nom. inval.)]|nr:hypothetical protein H8356DRAFT_1337394 [Neocallimastix sp. JGI-2020a]
MNFCEMPHTQNEPLENNLKYDINLNELIDYEIINNNENNDEIIDYECDDRKIFNYNTKENLIKIFDP